MAARAASGRGTARDTWRTKGYSPVFLLDAQRRMVVFCYRILTNEIMQGTFGLKVEGYKGVKGSEREKLRDHMIDIELILTMLAETITTKLHRDRDSQGGASR